MLRTSTARRLAFMLAVSLSPLVSVASETVHLYNWSDYFAEDTLSGFEAETGIRPRLDVYDSNEVLEAKLFAGSSGYDLVFPTARPSPHAISRRTSICRWTNPSSRAWIGWTRRS
jgi:putrescine transport system substrate-binding protein